MRGPNCIFWANLTSFLLKGFKVATTPPNETDVPATQDTVAHVCWDGVGLHIRERATGRETMVGRPGGSLGPPGRLPTMERSIACSFSHTVVP